MAIWQITGETVANKLTTHSRILQSAANTGVLFQYCSIYKRTCVRGLPTFILWSHLHSVDLHPRFKQMCMGLPTGTVINSDPAKFLENKAKAACVSELSTAVSSTQPVREHASSESFLLWEGFHSQMTTQTSSLNTLAIAVMNITDH